MKDAPLEHAFPPQAYLTRTEAAKSWLSTPSLDRVPRAKYVHADTVVSMISERIKEAARAAYQAAINDEADNPQEIADAVRALGKRDET